MSRLIVLTCILCIGCGEEALYSVPDASPEPQGQEIPNSEPEAETPAAPEPPDQPGFDESESEPEEETEAPPEEDAPPPPPDDCAGISDLIYVIDKEDESLYLFDPETGSLNFHGELDCAIFAGTPASMSVARDGYAYIRYADNTVYSVHLETMNCTETAYDADFGAFGMGYATAHATTWQDNLYIANANTLAKLNTETWSLDTLGTLPSQSELTGNGDGELWAILPLETPARLAHIDKNNAQVLSSINLNGFPDPYGIDTFAFATWGGEFFLFVRSYGMGSSTDVYRVRTDGSFDMVVHGTGLNIVGAGVSTCAPGQE
jgi:hypothetical protein